MEWSKMATKTDPRLTPEAVHAKVALDREYRPIGRIDTVDEDSGVISRIRISPHREFRQKYPEVTGETYVVDAELIAKLWGHNVVLDKDVKELLKLWKE